ncbi:CPA2 family monovalent cation:H+ antiporter-2 [Oxalobacteraceae bacterium GrIS 2.11]
MLEQTPLIATIVGCIVLAFVFGTLANKLSMPPLIGYLVAGILVGPYTPGFVADGHLAHELAEIGVIVLMFGVGLHFSLKDLLAVKTIAIPGALLQIVFATLLGMVLCWAMGWPVGQGIIFGLALSCASTVVLLTALQERRLVDTQRGQIAIGWLIVEDIVMVLALVLIPALSSILGGHGEALSNTDLARMLAITIGKVIAFVVVMVVFGKRAIPWILERIASTGSRELFGLCVLAIALGFALGSTYLFGVSFALGAFFAGMMLAESELSHRAAEESLPLREVFSVLFFVSVGMLFDPSILLREPLQVLATVLIIVVGKSLVSMALVLAFGRPLSTALTISASLAQIGEFSFILATLGISLGILPDSGRDLILAGAIISIILNPFVFMGLDCLKPWLEKREQGSSEQCELQHGHTILVGFGALGKLVGDELTARKIPFVIVEDHPDAIHDTHNPDIPAIYAHASAPGVLEQANIQTARCMVLTIPDTIVAGELIAHARSLNPAITTIARASTAAEETHLHKHGATHVILSKREMARSLVNLIG